MKALLIARLQDIGCLACRQDGNFHVPSDLHHPTDGGRRLGDDIVIPLCPFHHRGVGMPPFPGAPSLALSKRLFVQRYGTERELLAETERLMELRRG